MTTPASIPPPHAEIAPDEFFTNWLPTAYRTARAAVGGSVRDTAVVIALSGDATTAGGRWRVALTNGEISVESGPATEAHIVIRASVSAWRAMLAEAATHGDAPLPPVLDLPPAAHAAIHAAKGSLALRVTGFAEGDLEGEISLGGAATPAALISTDKDTLDGIRNGSLNPAQAFFGGKILMSGDTAFAMQLSMALMSPG